METFIDLVIASTLIIQIKKLLASIKGRKVFKYSILLYPLVGAIRLANINAEKQFN